MSGFSATWYLSIIPVCIAVVISIFATGKLSGVYNALNGSIKTSRDLEVVREAININMQMALLYIALWLVFLVILVLLVVRKTIPFPVAVGHLALFGVLTFPFAIWSKSVEKKFKSMVVDTDQQGIAETFQRWLVDWGKPGFKLKD